MATILPDAVEEGAYFPVVSFFDEDDAAVTPASATWTLTDGNGTVINSRTAVTITGLSTTATLALTGNDLAISTGELASRVLRKLLVQWLYTSSISGAGTPGTEEFSFYIKNASAL